MAARRDYLRAEQAQKHHPPVTHKSDYTLDRGVESYPDQIG